MKKLGIIINYKDDESKITLADCPDDIIEIKPDSIVHIGYTEKLAEPYKVISSEAFKKRITLNLEIKNKYLKDYFNEKAVFIDKTCIIYESSSGKPINELMDCEVFEFESGNLLGTINKILILPANDVWMIKMADGLLPVPVIDDVIKLIDTQKKRIEIVLIPGLIDLKQ